MADDSDVIWISDGEEEPLKPAEVAADETVIEDSFLKISGETGKVCDGEASTSTRKASIPKPSEVSIDLPTNSNAEPANSNDDGDCQVIADSPPPYYDPMDYNYNDWPPSPLPNVVSPKAEDVGQNPSGGRKQTSKEPECVILDDSPPHRESSPVKRPPKHVATEEFDNRQPSPDIIAEKWSSKILATTDSPKKKQRRTKDEITEEKSLKEAEKLKRAKEREQKEVARKRAKIEREISASTKSHVEKHLFCHIPQSVFDDHGGVEAAVKAAFIERNLEPQLVVKRGKDSSLITFQRSCIDLFEKSDGDVEKFVYEIQEPFFVYVIDGETLSSTHKTLARSIERVKTELSIPACNMVVTCIGAPKLSSNKLASLNVDLFSSLRVQLKVCGGKEEFAQYLVQLTRGLAKKTEHRKEESAQEIEKGVRTGPELVGDWWDRMLTTIYRLSAAAKRAIVKKIPSPVAGVDWVSDVGVDSAVQELANVVCENDRRIGNAVAIRIIRMLSDMEGDQCVD
ncbi:unnamed protein product, partial [Mesorhabditis spiculigera]